MAGFPAECFSNSATSTNAQPLPAINSKTLKLQRPLQDKELKILDSRLKQLNKKLRRQVRFLLIWTLVTFDAGEFYRDHDDKSIDPSEKYTRPLVESLLKQNKKIVSNAHNRQLGYMVGRRTYTQHFVRYSASVPADE